MTLRNPNLKYANHDFCQNTNVYVIGPVKVREQLQPTDLNSVELTIVCYADDIVEDRALTRMSEHNYRLVNLPADRDLLCPALYQSELIVQHGEEILDGTKIKDFEIL